MLGRILLTLCFTLAFLANASAFAEPKPWVYGWWPSHWENLDFEKTYLYDGKSRHNTQWDHMQWQPQDWIAQRKNGLQLIQGWYKAGIITDQYEKRDVPVLEVGPRFYNLGGRDKRRVVQTIDSVYEVTSQDKNAIFRIRDAGSGKYIGLYSRHGLMLE